MGHIMKGNYLIYLSAYLLSLNCYADLLTIKTRFSTLQITETAGPHFSIKQNNRTVFETDAIQVEQESLFQLSNQDVVLLRFKQGLNSRNDSLIFLSINHNGDINPSPMFFHTAGQKVEINENNQVLTIDSGIENNVHLYTSFNGKELSIAKKPIKAKERLEEPVPEEDCNKIYNSLYVKAFGSEKCGEVRNDIQQAFNTLTFKAMTYRSKSLDMEQLITLANQTCESKRLMVYADFKSKTCGYN